MIYEDIQVSGSISISGSFNVPKHASTASANQATGSLFFDTSAKLFKVFQSGAGALNVASQPFTLSPPAAKGDIEYLVVAGGGGSAYDSGGGAGAGGLLSSSIADIESGSVMAVTVGAGGGVQSNGTDSSLASTSGTSFTTVTSTGGGQGAGAPNQGYGYVAGDGGSGGGGSGGSYNNPGGSGIVGQGHDGGNSGTSGGGATYPGAGGGGAGAVGESSANSGGNGKAGGIGKQSSITGTATYYAGGGGGGVGSATAGAGGSGGGGAGGSLGTQGTPGTANTGGGAGGSSSTAGVAGGSGVVVLRYPSSSISAQGGTELKANSGERIHQFNSSGTLKVGNSTNFSDKSPAGYLPSGIPVPSVHLVPNAIGQDGDFDFIPNYGTLNHDFYRKEISSGTMDKANTSSGIPYLLSPRQLSGGSGGAGAYLQSTSTTRTLSSDFNTKQNITVNMFYYVASDIYSTTQYPYIFNFVPDTNNNAYSYYSEYASFHWRAGISDAAKFSTAFRNSSGTVLNTNGRTNSSTSAAGTWIMTTTVLTYGSSGTIVHYENGSVANSASGNDLTTGGATSNSLNFGGSYADQYINGGVSWGLIQVWMGTALTSSNVTTLWDYYKADYGLS